MKVFDDENKMSQDECALIAKLNANKSIADYRFFNNYFTNECREEIDQKMNEFVTNNANLRYKDGFGNVPSCSVDVDSLLRNKFQMNYRERTPLCTRWYTAVPNLGKGGLIPNIESRLKLSEDTNDIRDCDRVTEKTFDRFIPLPGCMSQTIQNPEHIIEKWTRGGEFTRDYVRNDEYLQKCGFTNDGKMWRRT